METVLEGGLLALSFLVPLLVILLGMPGYLGALARRGRVVDDVNKVPPTKVPSPAGPVLFAGALGGEVVAYVAFGSLVPLAILGAATVAFVVGIYDDLFVLGGKTKPALLILAAVPLVALARAQSNLYVPAITFPILGDTAPHFIIYTLLMVAAFPVVANAFNMIDAYNGEISWFTLLTSLALVFGISLRAAFTGGFSLARLASALPLLALGAGFLVFNRYPSRAFDGDSGSLMMGAMFAAVTITGGVEVAAMIAIVPAILNSFYTLSSVRGFVERRRIRVPPTYMGEDHRIYATRDPSAPTTLVGLVLLAGPQTEQELVASVLVLVVASCLLSAAVSVLTWVL